LGAQTQPASSRRPAAEQSLKERFENLGLIYQDKQNPGLQELWVLGRYHGHYHDNDGSHGQDSGFESRRIRLGFQATMFDRLTVHAQAISGSDFEPAYNGFTELWVRWQFAESLNLTVGQQKHRFTHDRNVSSRYLSFMEASITPRPSLSRVASTSWITMPASSRIPPAPTCGSPSRNWTQALPSSRP
jgi:phosphate-selective porin